MISVGVRHHPVHAYPLLKPDALGWTDAADDKSGYNERQDTNREGDDIQRKNSKPIEVYRDVRKIVTGGVQGYDSRPLLHRKEHESGNVANDEATNYQHGREVEEDAAQLSVGTTHGLHNSDKTCALKDND